MPERDFEADIELNHFVQSKEWQAMSEAITEIVIRYQYEIEDQVEKQNWHGASYTHGWLDALRWFLDLPAAIYNAKGEVKGNGRNTK